MIQWKDVPYAVARDKSARNVQRRGMWCLQGRIGCALPSTGADVSSRFPKWWHKTTPEVATQKAAYKWPFHDARGQVDTAKYARWWDCRQRRRRRRRCRTTEPDDLIRCFDAVCQGRIRTRSAIHILYNNTDVKLRWRLFCAITFV